LERKNGPNADMLRSSSGTYVSLNTSGGYIEMICPPFEDSIYPRYILSTNIVSEEVLDA
jgi:hypothetical protein